MPNPGSRTKENYIPTAEDFTAGAVQKTVMKETLQHPATILPAALCGGGIVWMLVISMTPAVFLVSLLAGAVSIGSWVWNFFMRGDAYAEAYIQGLRKARADRLAFDVSNLTRRCTSSDFAEGARVIEEIKLEYLKLKEFLSLKVQIQGNLNAERYLVHAEEAYRQSVRLMQKALDMHEALASIDTAKMKREKALWTKQLNNLRPIQTPSLTESSQIELLETRLEGHENQFKLHEEQSAKLHDMLAQCDRLKGVLETSYLKLVDLIQDGGSSLFATDDLVSRLERDITAAQNVEKRLRGMSEPNPDDQIYLKAGRQKSENERKEG